MELSVIIPCLNEEETVGICLKKIVTTLDHNKINYEIIVGNNNSTDNSSKIASTFSKVKIINVKKKGYGITLQTAIAKAQGEYILMADADDSYDFNDSMKFLLKLREGYELVQGCRFPSGGGVIMPGAMPLSHKIIGNPFFSYLSRLFYNVPFKDVYCGMRAFKKSTYSQNNYFSEGMFFAVENLIKLTVSGAKICEIPITLHKDKRIKTKSHLNTIKDGLKTLKLLLICNAKFLYFYPSLIILIFLIKNNFNTYFYKSHETSLTKDVLINFLNTFLLSEAILHLATLGIFTTIMSYQLGLTKEGFIIKMLRIFNLKNILAVLLPFLILLTYVVFKIFNSSIINIYYIFYIFLTYILIIQVILNCLFISLLELNKKNIISNL
jgi:glycosyltransferase involved in cell wall biosynthesis